MVVRCVESNLQSRHMAATYRCCTFGLEAASLGLGMLPEDQAATETTILGKTLGRVGSIIASYIEVYIRRAGMAAFERPREPRHL